MHAMLKTFGRIILMVLGAILSIIVGTSVSGYTSLLGAVAGGLEKGGWNWQFIPPLIYGWGVGFVLSLLSFLIGLRWGYIRGFIAGIAVPIIGTFVLAFATLFVMLAPERHSRHQFHTLLKDAGAHPEVLHRLIQEARHRPLTGAEKGVLWHMVWTHRAIPDKDIPFLIDFFADDGSALGGIMTQQNVTVEQLRYLYEKHKNQNSASNRVLPELSTHPLTPPDILQALTNYGGETVARKARERLMHSK